MTIQEIFEAVVNVETEITQREPGDPDLSLTISRIGELQRELERVRGGMGPLIPDAASPPSTDEVTAARLDKTLSNLMSAAQSKAEVD
jgi:hypothetical protein